MLQHHVSLLPFTTFGVNTLAQDFFQTDSVQEMIDFLSAYSTPYVVLGGGSNILFTREKVSAVIRMDNKEIELMHQTPEQVLVRVGAGMVWDDFVNFSVKQGWYGVENLSAIPGTVGAAPVQNIGAYGVEVSDCIHSVQGLFRSNRERMELDAQACKFAYRDSIFKRELKDQTIITHVVFRLRKNGELQLNYGAVKEEYLRHRRLIPSAMGASSGDLAAIEDLSVLREVIIAIRNRKLPDPKVMGNVGSYFKNPVVSVKQAMALQKLFPELPVYPGKDDQSRKLSAAWLIEQVGMKGYKMARVGVHKLQPLVLVNYGMATAGEILALENLVALNVQSKFGISLEAEVNKY